MSDIKQIFLDLDGPLLEGKERHYYCYRSILERYGFEPIGIDEYWIKKRALVNRRDLLSMSGAEEIYDDFLAEWLALIESPEMLALDKVQEGALECLRGWKERGVTLTLVTMRRNRQALIEQLESTGLLQCFDSVLICDHAEVGQGKADAVRGILQHQIETFVENSLWIGDTEADWEAAGSLGVDVVLVTNGLRDEEHLTSLKNALVLPSINMIVLPHD